MDKDKVKLMRQLVAEYKKDLKQNGEKLFLDATKDLFEKYPDLEWFQWKQYTPYFNDGDECVFHSQYEYPDIKLLSEGDAREGGWFDEEKEKPLFKMAEDITKTLGSFEEEDYKLIFGDHVSVTVFKDRIEVEEYEHD